MQAKKSLGQNFIKSKKVVEKMASVAEEYPDAAVIEIGPGMGALTEILLEKISSNKNSKVLAIEKDNRLISLLEEKFSKQIAGKKLQIIHDDALKLDYDALTKNKPWLLIANIPYYITGQIIRRTLTANYQPQEIVLLLQKEVAERIARSKKESLLSLSVKAYGTPLYLGTVSKKLFSPQPKVDSAMLRIKNISKNNFKDATEEELFFKLIHAGFAHKRKKLVRNLEKVLGKNAAVVFKEMNLSENTRAEDLNFEDWKKIIKNHPVN